jgi:TrmH family RNA methyltransferase
MVSKNEVKYIQSLYHKKTRSEERLFVVEGPKLTGEVLQSTFTIRTIYATAEWLKGNGNIDGVTVKEVTAEELSRLSHLQTANQVLAVVEQPTETGIPQQDQLSLVLDGIQDPGNLGTIIRIADWFGITQIIASDDTVELFNPKVLQSTMGSFLRVKVWYQDIEAFLQSSKQPVYGALLNGENVTQHAGIKQGLLIIGNESKGIRPNIMPYVQHALTIPRLGHAESLNAAVATGILLSHVIKA